MQGNRAIETTIQTLGQRVWLGVFQAVPCSCTYTVLLRMPLRSFET